MSELEIIAKIIGYHFWQCKNDKEAIELGMDCAKEIIKALKEKKRGNNDKV